MHCSLPLVLFGAALAAQTPVDLTAWNAESYQAVSGFGNGVWTTASGGFSVTQSVNGQPTMFVSDFELWSVRIEGQVVVTTGADNDFFGFALGYQPGDTTNPNADYLLLDWKRGTQSFNFGAPSCTPGSVAQAGIALSRVQGLPTADEFWGHVDLDAAPCSTANDKLTELQRGATLGATSWVSNQTYTVRIDYTPTRVVVHVDGVLQIDASGAFGNGRVAFYNFSQAGVVYSAFTQDCIASWNNYGAGFPGELGVPGLTASAPPVFGATFDVEMASASTAPRLAVLAFGWAPLDVPTPLGGAVLVDFVVTEALVAPAAPALALRPFAIPLNPVFCGVTLYAQFLHGDPAAAQHFAFSRGLALAIGN